MRILHVLRKPLSAPSVAANVLEYSCGALHINTGRVGGNNGRWPSNMILEHSEGCDPECVEGCPVSELDAGGTQTRDHAKRDTHQATLHASPVKFGHSAERHQFTYGDGGGSARYFKQINRKR